MISLLTLITIIHNHGVDTIKLWDEFILHFQKEVELNEKLTSIFNDLKKVYECCKYGFEDSCLSQKSFLKASTIEFDITYFREFIRSGLLIKKYNIEMTENKYPDELNEIVIEIAEKFSAKILDKKHYFQF